MKFYTTILILLLSTTGLAQPILNERYNFGADAAIFGSVIATDSCYYVTGMQAYNTGSANQQGAFIKFNLDGSIADTSFIASDTMEFIFWELPVLTKTLDGNFAQTVWVNSPTGYFHFAFLKFKPNGDTLIANYIYNLTDVDTMRVLKPTILIQNKTDSSYLGLVRVERLDVYLVGTALIKLDKYGNLLWHKIYYGIAPNNYEVYNANSLIQYDTNTLIIGGTIVHTAGFTANDRFHTKLIFTDTLGNIDSSRTYIEDTLSNECNGLTKTRDNGLLYCGQNGHFEDNGSYIGFQKHIVKLDSNFTFEWKIELGAKVGFTYMKFHELLTLNDSTFVAVGKSMDTIVLAYNGSARAMGSLVKFNINGDIIWNRKYTKVPLYNGENNLPLHELYDIDITTDSGFVMVGQSINYHQNASPNGQMGWLIKTDKHGCLIPNCHNYDGSDIVGLSNNAPKPLTNILVYPNPASNELFVYYATTNFTGKAQAYMYNIQGKQVQQWPLNTNHTTYMVDISTLSKGIYVLKITENNQILNTKKIVVE